MKHLTPIKASPRADFVLDFCKKVSACEAAATR
jgi:hypothetical protein